MDHTALYSVLNPTINSCVNHTTVEDILEGEEVLVGTFLLFGHPIIILFDSGGSHGFITSACAKRVELSLIVTMLITLGLSSLVCEEG
jgi:hypothetical protein